ncbi:hypothetical protein B0A50_08551 [Salinomyces thailandicus]|uniref:tRNA wybutosine-synthesizing protein 2 n=1 Tax=Salinomyces thailandicus TaxID=706561 RepID=A0A4U0TJG0_9PEZI|nr:hypothetical protein B0A50_08551 [Salinomyces thailandica]
MQTATSAWIATLDDPAPSCTTPFISKLNRAYVTYGTLVLLPASAYDELERSGLDIETLQTALNSLYKLISHHLKLTHIALTRPIPPQRTIPNRPDNSPLQEENTLRAPANFTPLHGDFGPSTASSPPTLQDFSLAFWTTAKQNSIYQTWSPRWTMFSRGNISEKARLLTLESVVRAVEEGAVTGRGCAAVDLYVGIGYFGFSYLKAGVRRVLGWDLNGWSVEGLVRGAGVNGWGVRKVSSSDGEGLGEALGSEARLLVFQEDNVKAGERVEEARAELPPIRHVNCGLLPTSRGSWETAVRVLDAGLGGWIHVHENFAISEIESKAEEVRQDIQRLAAQRAGYELPARAVRVEHINKLKSYAPGVIHCVLDIAVPPLITGP